MDFDAVADELFALPPAAFIERRNALAATARAEDDVELAATIKALRRPTVGAALVNALVRQRGEVMASLFTLGAELREAQDRGDGPALRVLMGRRQDLIRALDRGVAELASGWSLTATRAVLQDVHATLFTALSHPGAEALVRGGQLESALNDGMFDASAPATSVPAARAARAEPEPVASSSTMRIESAQRKLDEADASAAAAERAVETLADSLSGAQVELAELERQLDETLKEARQLERDRSTADRKVTTATDAHADAVRHAKALREAVAKAKRTYEQESATQQVVSVRRGSGHVSR